MGQGGSVQVGLGGVDTSFRSYFSPKRPGFSNTIHYTGILKFKSIYYNSVSIDVWGLGIEFEELEASTTASIASLINFSAAWISEGIMFFLVIPFFGRDVLVLFHKSRLRVDIGFPPLPSIG